MLSFFNMLIVFVASFTIIYFLMPNQAKIVISAFKTGFFIGALIGLSFYKLLANFLSIKLYHYLLSRDKNYHIDEKGFNILMKRVLIPIKLSFLLIVMPIMKDA